MHYKGLCHASQGPINLEFVWRGLFVCGVARLGEQRGAGLAWLESIGRSLNMVHGEKGRS